MKLAIYSHSIAPSIDGVCRRYTAILHELVKQGTEVVLFTIESEPQGLPEGIEVITLDHMIMPAYPGKKVARPTLGVLMKILSQLREHRPDVVHVTNDGFSHMFALAGKLLGITVVGSYHTDLQELLRKHDAALLQKFLIWLKEFTDSYVLDGLATTSISFKEKLAKTGIHCQHIIETSVSMETFHPKKRSNAVRKRLMFGNANGFLCLYTGRISNEKRIDLILAAVQKLDNAYLAVVGDGPIASKYAEMHGEESRLYCKPGFCNHDELAPMYASSDVHVSGSEFETLGNTVLEAHACGIPVVVPLTQGFRDTVSHTQDGFLFTPGDTDDAVRYLEILQKNTSTREQMGAAALKKVEKNTVESVVANLRVWYTAGQARKLSRNVFYTAFSYLVMTITIPTGVVSLGCYDLLMAALALVGYVPSAM
jgi:glycosyltransferase involved in cell wall biosynthesis